MGGLVSVDGSRDHMTPLTSDGWEDWIRVGRLSSSKIQIARSNGGRESDYPR